MSQSYQKMSVELLEVPALQFAIEHTLETVDDLTAVTKSGLREFNARLATLRISDFK